jgi:hypothetical protein
MKALALCFILAAAINPLPLEAPGGLARLQAVMSILIKAKGVEHRPEQQTTAARGLP